MGKMIDVAAFQTAANKAQAIKDAGYGAVAGYYFHASSFKQQLTASAAQQMKAAGLYIVSIWESGYPTTPGYFTREQGIADAQGAIARAAEATQPFGTPIYWTYDTDASDDDVQDAMPYAQAFHDIAKEAGWLASAYGPGALLKALSEAGIICNNGWLSESRSFNGTAAWRSSATIVQLTEATVLGMDVDTNETNGDAGGWQPQAAIVDPDQLTHSPAPEPGVGG